MPLLLDCTRKSRPAVVAATASIANNCDERRAATLWASWAAWSRRFNDSPTPANDRREALAWAALTMHVDASDLTDTAFDPRD